eukprot:5575958-Prymnesium_polylepis.2
MPRAAFGELGPSARSARRQGPRSRLLCAAAPRADRLRRGGRRGGGHLSRGAAPHARVRPAGHDGLDATRPDGR